MKQNLKIALSDNKKAAGSYVLVNPMLAKYIPTEPDLALEYFAQLGQKVAVACVGERVLVVGFAETTTAVGIAVATAIGNATYVHTIKEDIPQDKPAAEFMEEHNHIKEQALYLKQEFKDLKQYDRIVFVENEIRTGTSILNFLKSINWNGKIIVSALIFNGFDESLFLDHDALFICLQKIKTEVKQYIEFDNFPNPRSGVNISNYNECCRNLASKIIMALDNKDIKNKDILVIGTEEFMYPALYLGRELKITAKSVKSHSATGEPLLPWTDAGYPADYTLKTRDSFAGIYDCERRTYLYDLKKYDTVIVISDSIQSNNMELLCVFLSHGNQRIYLVGIRNDE